MKLLILSCLLLFHLPVTAGFLDSGGEIQRKKLILPSIIQSLRGPISNGGGVGVACTGSTGKVTLEVLDYFETKALYGKEKMLNPTGDWVEDFYNLSRNTYRLQGINDFQEVIDNFDIVSHNIDSIFKIVKWVNSSELPLLFDFGETVTLPNNCQFKQIAIYQDRSNQLKISKDLWNQLDSLNKAVLIEHEVIYFHERKKIEYNSETTRSYLQQILTAEHQAPVFTDKNEASLFCTSLATTNHNFYFYVHKTKDGSSRLQFSTFNKRSLYVHSVASFDLEFEVKERFDNIPYSIPSDPTVLYSKRVPFISAHSKKWEVQLDYIGGHAITIQSYKDGQPTSAKEKVYCRKNL